MSKSNGTMEKYFEDLVVITDEIRNAMLGLDFSIKRLEQALAKHHALKAELDDEQ